MGGKGQDAPLGRELQERVIAALFSGLHKRSVVGLEQAVQIRETPGVAATMVVQIPTDAAKPCEIYLSTGPVRLVQDLSKS